MGLDIIAYSRLRYIGKHEFDPELNEGEPGPHCYYEEHVQAYAYRAFTRSFRGIPIVDQDEHFIRGGCFVQTEETQTHSFHAGSYGGYNAWRANLADQFNPAPVANYEMEQPNPEGPFYELIWFADNEGTISTAAAASLLTDFRTYADRYQPPNDDVHGGWYAAKYSDWARAFELAADGGLVDFH